jgi:hypothetical protein
MICLFHSSTTHGRKTKYHTICQGIRDIRKVSKRQNQYLEFGRTQGEIQKKTAKKYISIQGVGETKKTINFDGS